MKSLSRFSAFFIFFLSFAMNCSAAEEDHPSNEYATNLPPSAQLKYKIKASRSILSVSGEANITWQVTGSKPNQTYSITTDTSASILGKILDTKSNGIVNSFGLAPNLFEEHRLNKNTTQTTFDRDAKLIKFSEAPDVTYPIKGGEQDRSSIVWQLISVARATPTKFTPNSQWTFFVAGRRDAEKWTFTVNEEAKLPTPVGNITTVHVVKAPPPDSQDQRLDVWLAPSLEWYPVRLKFSDADGNIVDQNLTSITNNSKKSEK